MKAQQIFCLSVIAITATFTSSAICQESTAWLHKTSLDADFKPMKSVNPSHPSLKWIGQQLQVSADCAAVYSKERYDPIAVFQAAIKSGREPKDIQKAFQIQFGIDLNKIKFIYSKNFNSRNCNSIDQYFIVDDERLIFMTGGIYYDEYNQTFTRIVYDRDHSPADLGKLKPSQLPFDLTALNTNCLLKHLPFSKGIPLPTEKCAPNFYLYVATKRSTDWLSKLVGSFDYRKNNVRHANYDYENPVAKGMHPVFTVLPPMEDIIIVRVEDMEYSEHRDSMSGTYLSIRNGKVIDVLSEGCDFDVSYTCISHNPDEKFQVQSDGHFKKLQ